MHLVWRSLSRHSGDKAGQQARLLRIRRLARASFRRLPPSHQGNLRAASWFGRTEDEYDVMLDTPGQVQSVRPDLKRIRRLPVSRVLVTAAGGDGYAQM